jgi:hypothetical protein
MRLTATAATLLAGLVLLAGCQKSTPDASASANTSVGQTPAASAPASTEPSPGGEPGSSPSAAGCKMSGKATGGTGFAAQFMKAWLACDTAALKELTTGESYSQVVKIGVPKIDMNWAYVMCDGAMGSSYCTYRNKLGSDLILRLTNDATSHAIADVKLDATVYHSDALKYAKEFLDAFTSHNKPRMVALSSQAIVDSIVVDAPPAGYTITLSPEPHWVYNAQFTATGEYWVVTIHGALGKAHAITAFGNAG